jgi:hypothetical protein
VYPQFSKSYRSYDIMEYRLLLAGLADLYLNPSAQQEKSAEYPILTEAQMVTIRQHELPWDTAVLDVQRDFHRAHRARR